MPVDTSMYQTIQPPAPVQQQQQPSMLDSLSKAYYVAGEATKLRTQQAIKNAYANNVDPTTGQLNQQGVMSDLYRDAPQAALQMKTSMAEADKAQADAKTAQLTAAKSVSDYLQPKMEYLATVSDADRPQAYNQVMQEAAANGVPMQNVPKDSQGNYLYDQNLFQQHLMQGRQSAQYLDQQLKQSEIAKNITEANLAPAKYNTEVYGSRSPTNTLAEAYNKEVAPIRSSGMAMNQMMDNYNHPSPQGDASLILNAFKIKFPTAPDVNSLEELSKSQAAPDQWKQMANHAISGGLDQGTRDNLMRDAVSTYRANYGTYQDTAQKYKEMAQDRNAPLGGITKEPALDRTMANAADLQKQLGPYVPPSQRGGASGFFANLASKITGTSSGQSANTSGKLSASSIKPGDVRRGYVFNGGDPTSPSNWKKAY